MDRTGCYEQSSRHWRFAGVAYFVTWRVVSGAAPLTETERDGIVNALMFFHRDRYILNAYVVMDDHVHVLVRPVENNQLSRIIHSWKSYTANEINRLRHVSGALWQADYFDRVIENEREFEEKATYILNNPKRRWPAVNEYRWAGWNTD